MLLKDSQTIGERLPVGPSLMTGSGASPVPLLAAPQDGGTLALPRSGPSGQWIGAPKVYRRFQFRHPALVAWLTLLVLAGAGAGAYVLTRHHAQQPQVHRVKRVTPPIPTVPVAVLNATSVTGAAHRLAISLRADRIKVITVGNFQATLPPGNEILYRSGERTQAKRLERLLGKNTVATVAPIDPVTEAAAGSDARLVVVIT
jgi:hypothetical protein